MWKLQFSQNTNILFLTLDLVKTRKLQKHKHKIAHEWVQHCCLLNKIKQSSYAIANAKIGYNLPKISLHKHPFVAGYILNMTKSQKHSVWFLQHDISSIHFTWTILGLYLLRYVVPSDGTLSRLEWPKGTLSLSREFHLFFLLFLQGEAWQLEQLCLLVGAHSLFSY